MTENPKGRGEKIKIPIIGRIVSDKRLGNKVIYYEKKPTKTKPQADSAAEEKQGELEVDRRRFVDKSVC